MPTRITLIYHAYKNFEVPNKIAKMINDGTIQWRSHHDDIYYTDENGKEQRVSSSSEFVAWEGHDDYEVEEAEESDEEEDDDSKSVHSTCCVECGESFKFDEPVSAEDYENGKHDQHCPSCKEEDCLAGNPKCVKCKIYLSEDDMAVWTEDTTKEPMCESCLDEEKSDSE